MSDAAAATTNVATEPMYIFGYGSLLFKQNFKFSRMINGRVQGFTRVFYQGSTDHRGVPGAPGRVVTILPSEEFAAAQPAGTLSAAAPSAFVDGIVFEVQPEHIAETIEYLDMREQGGYDRLEAPVYEMVGEGAGDKVIVPKCVLYIANSTNDEYLGYASEEAIAAQIISCSGPSGPNREYLFRLADSLRAMGAEDPHVFAIDLHARTLEAAEQQKSAE